MTSLTLIGPTLCVDIYPVTLRVTSEGSAVGGDRPSRGT